MKANHIKPNQENKRYLPKKKKISHIHQSKILLKSLQRRNIITPVTRECYYLNSRVYNN